MGPARGTGQGANQLLIRAPELGVARASRPCFALEFQHSLAARRGVHGHDDRTVFRFRAKVAWASRPWTTLRVANVGRLLMARHGQYPAAPSNRAKSENREGARGAAGPRPREKLAGWLAPDDFVVAVSPPSHEACSAP
jgi:hypothetical protein